MSSFPLLLKSSTTRSKHVFGFPPHFLFNTFPISFFLSLRSSVLLFSRVLSLVGFQTSLIGAEYGASAQERRLERNVAIIFSLNRDVEAIRVGSNSLRACVDDASRSLQCHMLSQPLDHDEGHELIDIRTPVIVHEMKSIASGYTSHTMEVLLHTLADFCTSDSYAWESQQ